MGVTGLNRFVTSRSKHERREFPFRKAGQAEDDGEEELLVDVMMPSWRKTALVIDGIGFAYHLFGLAGLDWKNGGDLKGFHRFVKDYGRKLAKALELHVFVDNLFAVDERKIGTTLVRREMELRRIAANIKYDNIDAVSGFVLPLLAVETMLHALEPVATIHHAKFQAEADPDIAHFCRKADFDCVVLSNDSDFFIFQGVKWFCFFKDLEIVENVEHKSGFVVVYPYDTKQAALALGLPDNIAVLACFAALAGNDHSDPELLAVWQKKICFGMSTSAQNTPLQGSMFASKKKKNRKKKKRRNATSRSGLVSQQLPDQLPQNNQTLVKKVTGFLKSFIASNSNDLEDASTFIANISKLLEPKEPELAEEVLTEQFLMFSGLEMGQPTEQKHCYWWPRPVLESFDREKTIFALLTPLRSHLFQSGEEWGPLSLTYEKQMRKPLSEQVENQFATFLAKMNPNHRSSVSATVLSLAHFCLHLEKCAERPFSESCVDCLSNDQHEALCKVPQQNETSESGALSYSQKVSFTNLYHAIIQLLIKSNHLTSPFQVLFC